jgi:hypothetical protein
LVISHASMLGGGPPLVHTLTHLNRDVSAAVCSRLLTAQDFHNFGVRCKSSSNVELIHAPLLALVREHCNNLNPFRSLLGGIGGRIKVQLLAVVDVTAIDTNGMVSKSVQSSSQLVEGSFGVIVGGPDGFPVVRGVVASEM